MAALPLPILTSFFPPPGASSSPDVSASALASGQAVSHLSLRAGDSLQKKMTIIISWAGAPAPAPPHTPSESVTLGTAFILGLL